MSEYTSTSCIQASSLPAELLGDIFVRTLPSLSEMERHGSEDSPTILWTSKFCMPLTVSSVCKRWRDVALSTPRLWSFIIVELIRRETLEKTLVACKTWIERSKDMPLTFACFGNPEYVKAIDFQFFNLMFLLLPRIRHLLLDLEYGYAEVYNFPNKHFPMPSSFVYSAPLLESAIVYFSLDTEHPDPSDEGLVPLREAITSIAVSAPNMREMDMVVHDPHNRTSGMWGFPTQVPNGLVAQPGWQSLTKANAKNVCPDSALVLLYSCPSVIDLSLHVFGDRPTWKPSSLSHLPQLKKFTLFCPDDVDLQTLFDHLVAPSLTDLDVTFMELNPIALQLRETFSNFISRSGCKLTALRLSVCPMEEDLGFSDDLPFSVNRAHCEHLVRIELRGLTVRAAMELLEISPNVVVAQLELSGVREGTGLQQGLLPSEGALLHLPHLRQLSLFILTLRSKKITELGLLLGRLSAPSLETFVLDTHTRGWDLASEPWPLHEVLTFLSRSHGELLCAHLCCVSSTDLLPILKSLSSSTKLRALIVWGICDFFLSDEVLDYLTVPPRPDSDAVQAVAAPTFPRIHTLNIVNIASWPRGRLAAMARSRFAYGGLTRFRANFKSGGDGGEGQAVDEDDDEKQLNAMAKEGMDVGVETYSGGGQESSDIMYWLRYY